MSTGYCWHELYGWHNTGLESKLQPGAALEPIPHMEAPEAKRRLNSLVAVSGMLDRLAPIRPRSVSVEDLARIHTERYIEYIRRLSERGGGLAAPQLNDSPFGGGGFEIARLSAGGVLTVTEAVLAGEVDNGYALVRPPGHHAERDSGLGFCLFANIAIAIEAIRSTRPRMRVAVVDWDVHHGNGTQHIFEADPGVLAISIHEDSLYPTGSGTLDERGAGDGEGFTLNIPLPAGSGNGAYLDTLEQVVVPALDAFAPDLIIVACGLDAGAMDPLGHQTVTAAGFHRMTGVLLDAAARLCAGRIVFAHEGGYSPFYAPRCGLAVIERLTGHDTGIEDPFGGLDRLPSQKTTAAQREVIARAAALRIG